MTNNVGDEMQAAKPSRSVEPAEHENLLLAKLRRQLAAAGPWAHRFRQLAEAIAEAEDVEPVPLGQSQNAQGLGLDCEECEGLLDIYVDDELAGRNVQHLYPRVWQHFQTCTRCQRAHGLIADTLNQEREGKLIPIPHLEAPRLSFLRSYSTDAPWITRLRPRLSGAPFGLVFSFNLAYLRTLLAPPVFVAARTEEPLPTPTTRLLLADTISIDRQTLVVEVTAIHRPENHEHMDLRALISGSGPLPENLWARLTWADQIRLAPVDVQGQVDFGEVSLIKLQEALEAGTGNFEIAFESMEKVE